jgi:ABC-2 type transport system permease protein
VRSKELRLRLLDKNKVEEERTYWQVINTGGPLLLVILLGIFRFYRRKAKYAS